MKREKSHCRVLKILTVHFLQYESEWAKLDKPARLGDDEVIALDALIPLGVVVIRDKVTKS